MDFVIGQAVIIKNGRRYIHTPTGSWGYITEISEQSGQALIKFRHIATKRRKRHQNKTKETYSAYLNDIEPYRNDPIVDRTPEPLQFQGEQQQKLATEDLVGRIIDKLVIKDGVVQHIRQTIKKVLPLEKFIEKTAILSKPNEITTPFLPLGTVFYFEKNNKAEQIFVTEIPPGAHSLSFDKRQTVVSLPWTYLIWLITNENKTISVEVYYSAEMIKSLSKQLFQLQLDHKEFQQQVQIEEGKTEAEAIEQNVDKFFKSKIGFNNLLGLDTIEQWEQKTLEDDLFILDLMKKKVSDQQGATVDQIVKRLLTRD